MLFAVPSKGRGDQQTRTGKILPSSVYYVPENEVKDYVKSHKNKIVGVPVGIKGITATRNWILKNCNERRVVMVDDDVKVCGWVNLLATKAKHTKLKDEQEWYLEINKVADVCEDLGYKIFGISTHSTPSGVYGYKPYMFKSYVLGSFFGIINDGEYYFDESFKVKEDYELCLRHIKEKGGIVAYRNLYWECEHWIKDGGCKDYRTQTMESEAISKLIKLYPNLIRRITKGRGGSQYAIELEF